MEKNAKLGGWMLAGTVAAILAGLSGCNENETRYLDSGVSKDNGFAMVSDTTAIFPVHYYDHLENKLDDWEECTKMGIRLVDTRGSEQVYWEGLLDSCESNPNIASIGDSTVLFWFWKSAITYEEQSYFIWKIGQDPVEKKALWTTEYADIYSSIVALRKWKDGLFLFKNSSNFALLDTAENTLTKVSKEEAGWPDSVQDAQYFDGNLMTVAFLPQNRCSFAIVKNGADTLATHLEDSCAYSLTSLNFNGKYVDKVELAHSNEFLFSTDSLWQISEKPVAWYILDLYFKPLDNE